MASYHETQRKYANDIKDIFEALEPFRGDPHVEHGIQNFFEKIENKCPTLKTLEDQRDYMVFIYHLAVARKLLAEKLKKHQNPNNDKPLPEEAI